MTNDLWARARRLFGKPSPSRKLEQALAGWSAEERPGNAGSTIKREMLHPMKGWVIESPDLAADETNPLWTVRDASHFRTRAW
jgi:hypothetical protein